MRKKDKQILKMSSNMAPGLLPLFTAPPKVQGGPLHINLKAVVNASYDIAEEIYKEHERRTAEEPQLKPQKGDENG